MDGACRPICEAVEPWTAGTTEQAVRAFAERKGLNSAPLPSPCAPR